MRFDEFFDQYFTNWDLVQVHLYVRVMGLITGAKLKELHSDLPMIDDVLYRCLIEASKPGLHLIIKIHASEEEGEDYDIVPDNSEAELCRELLHYTSEQYSEEKYGFS